MKLSRRASLSFLCTAALLAGSTYLATDAQASSSLSGEGETTKVERVTVSGTATDDKGNPLDGVSITAKSLNSSVPFEAETITAGGTYSFSNAPVGPKIEIVAGKPGFTTRRRVEVLKSNKQGDPDANRYDFTMPPLETVKKVVKKARISQ